MQDKKVTEEVQLTCYSLFKQISMGDADELAKHKNNTPAEKYSLWL